MMKMPKITQCDVNECAYNTNNICHALAITVGDGTHPRCDTFCEMAAMHAGDKRATGNVGACKITICKFNEKLECQASSIRVSHHSKNCADCMTFEKT